MHDVSFCRSGGIGRRSRLKICRWQQRTGSSPVFGTTCYVRLRGVLRGLFWCLRAVRQRRMTADVVRRGFCVCSAAGMAMMWRDRDGEARLLEWYGAARLHGGGGGSLACGDAGGVCRRGCGGVAVLPGGGRALRDGGAGGPARHAVGGGAGGGPDGGCARQGMPGGPPERGGADPHGAFRAGGAGFLLLHGGRPYGARV